MPTTPQAIARLKQFRVSVIKLGRKAVSAISNLPLHNIKITEDPAVGWLWLELAYFYQQQFRLCLTWLLTGEGQPQKTEQSPAQLGHQASSIVDSVVYQNSGGDCSNCQVVSALKDMTCMVKNLNVKPLLATV